MKKIKAYVLKNKEGKYFCEHSFTDNIARAKIYTSEKTATFYLNKKKSYYTDSSQSCWPDVYIKEITITEGD